MLTGRADNPLPKSINPAIKLNSLMKLDVLRLSLTDIDLLPEQTVSDIIMIKNVEHQVLAAKQELERSKKKRGR